MRISKSIMCINLGDPRSHDHELTRKYVHKKTKIFGLEIYKFACNSKTTWRAIVKFVYNVGAYQCLMQA